MAFFYIKFNESFCHRNTRNNNKKNLCVVVLQAYFRACYLEKDYWLLRERAASGHTKAPPISEEGAWLRLCGNVLMLWLQRQCIATLTVSGVAKHVSRRVFLQLHCILPHIVNSYDWCGWTVITESDWKLRGLLRWKRGKHANACGHTAGEEKRNNIK